MKVLNDMKEKSINNKTMLRGRPPKELVYKTQFGFMFQGRAEEIMAQPVFERLKGRVQLIFTSPPFPLNRKKKYGNLTGEEYINWLASFGPYFKRMLTPDGSIIIEMGNSWEAGYPTMSTLAVKALLEFKERNELILCQEFICHNPARLPTPAQWVNVERLIKHFGKPTLDPLKKMSDDECERFLTALPGIGKKTARCVMLYSLDRQVFPVDTHCWRISTRLGWHSNTNKNNYITGAAMDKLQALIPPALRFSLHVNMVSHGRKICTAQTPRCCDCVIAAFCQSKS